MDIYKYAHTIANFNLFSGFTKEELNKIFNSSKFEIKKYGKGQIIHLQNDICHTMDIILNGKVSFQKIDESGKVLTVNVFSTGDILGVNLMFSSRNCYPMTFVSKTSVMLLHMHKELVIELCQNSESFMIGLMTVVSDKTIMLIDEIKFISLKSIRQCIIVFLRYEYNIQKNTVIKLNISKKDFAERLGIQRTSLNRELNKMRKDGLLEYDARTITLKNIDLSKEWEI